LDSPFKFRRGLLFTFIELLSLENPLYAQKVKKSRNTFRNITAATYRLAKRNAKAVDLHNRSLRIVPPVSYSPPLQRKT
jgi:hypothetical protein